MSEKQSHLTLTLPTNLSPSHLRQQLQILEPFGHRIDFSNGLSTADLQRRQPFAEHALVKFAKIKPHIPFEKLIGKAVLDVGCNAGHNALHCAATYGMAAVGIDVVPRLIQAAQLLAQVSQIPATFLLADAENFSRPEAFDLILHLGTLYHLQNPLRSLQTTYENLKPGGYLALETQLYDHPDDEDICYFMHGHYGDLTNFFALSTKTVVTSLALMGFTEIEERFRVSPPMLAQYMSRTIFTARKPG